MQSHFTIDLLNYGLAWPAIASRCLDQLGTEVLVVVAAASLLTGRILDRRPPHLTEAFHLGLLAAVLSAALTLLLGRNGGLFEIVVRSLVIGAILYGATRFVFGFMALCQFLLADTAIGALVTPPPACSERVSEISRTRFRPIDPDPIEIEDEEPINSRYRVRIDVGDRTENLRTVFDRTRPWSVSELGDDADNT